MKGVRVWCAQMPCCSGYLCSGEVHPGEVVLMSSKGGGKGGRGGGRGVGRDCH